MNPRINRSTHYGSYVAPMNLSSWAINAAKRFKKITKNDTAPPMLIYSGMSGTAHAVALQMELIRAKGCPFYGAYIRKEHEKSHGVSVEYTAYNCQVEIDAASIKRFVFVDDFIDYGRTFQHCLNAVRHKAGKDAVVDALLHVSYGSYSINVTEFYVDTFGITPGKVYYTSHTRNSNA